MATKRNEKQAEADKAAAIIQRGAGGRFVARKEERPLPEVSPAIEARAAREPAVTFAQTLAARLEETRKPSVMMRVLAWFRRPKPTVADKMEMADHMAAVKAGVLQELESIGAKKGVAIKGSPFASIVLPVKPAQATRRVRWWWVALPVVLLATVGMMAWLGLRGMAPEATMARLLDAAQRGDVEAVSGMVDVPSVAGSVANQLFNLSPQDVLAVDAAALARPGVVTALQAAMLGLVDGRTEAPDDVLLRLRDLLGGDKVSLGQPRIALRDEQMAVAEVPLVRKDLGLSLPLQVVLENRAKTWVVVNVPNFTAVLGGVVQASQLQAERRLQLQLEADAAHAAANGHAVQVDGLHKRLSDDGKTLHVRALVRNVTEAPVSGQVQLVFGDAAGRELQTLRLPLVKALPANAVRAQEWALPVAGTDAHFGYVVALPLTAMTVTATLVP